MKTGSEERHGGVYRLLGSSRLYTLIQQVLSRSGRWDLERDYYFPSGCSPVRSVLDIGCGPATFLTAFGHADDFRYVGFDPNPDYIRTAERELGDRGKFHVGTTHSLSEQLGHGFDLIVARGVLHHLDDQQARHVISFAAERLSGAGRFVSTDPVFVPQQHPVAGFLARIDRGRHVRHIDAYADLFRGIFEEGHIDVALESRLLRVPYDIAVSVSHPARL